MAIAFGTATTVANTTAKGDVTVTVPASTANGDLLLMCVSNSSTAGAWTTPAGWTVLDAATGGGDVEVATYWRVASSEPASYVVSTSDGSQIVGTMLRYTGVFTSGPIRTHGSSVGFGTTSPAAPVLSGIQSTDMIVIFFGYAMDVAASSFTMTAPGAPWTSRANITSAMATSRNAGIVAVDALGSTATPTATASPAGGGGWMDGAVSLALAGPPRALRIPLQAVNRASTY